MGDWDKDGNWVRSPEEEKIDKILEEMTKGFKNELKRIPYQSGYLLQTSTCVLIDSATFISDPIKALEEALKQTEGEMQGKLTKGRFLLQKLKNIALETKS